MKAEETVPTVIVAQPRGFGYDPLHFPVGRHLMNRAVRQPSNQLLAFVAPSDAADLRLQTLPLGVSGKLALLEVGHEQVAVVGHDGA